LDFGNSWTLEDNRSLEARFEHRTSKIWSRSATDFGQSVASWKRVQIIPLESLTAVVKWKPPWNCPHRQTVTLGCYIFMAKLLPSLSTMQCEQKLPEYTGHFFCMVECSGCDTPSEVFRRSTVIQSHPVVSGGASRSLHLIQRHEIN
jgi:hypothetical protein